jgi:hypothetical protein
MVRPVGRPMARKPITLEDLREEFLAHCESRNLSGRTLDWYSDRTRRFTDWCATQGIDFPSDLRLSDLERFVVITLGVWALIAVWDAVIQDYLGGRYLHYGAELLRTVQRIALDLAVVSALVMLALLLYAAWHRLRS